MTGARYDVQSSDLLSLMFSASYWHAPVAVLNSELVFSLQSIRNDNCPDRSTLYMLVKLSALLLFGYKSLNLCD